jgi:hypothetical protein
MNVLIPEDQKKRSEELRNLVTHYCSRCSEFVAFFDREVKSFLATNGDYRDADHIEQGFRLEIKVSIDCSLCAMIFDQLSIAQITTMTQLSNPHFYILPSFHHTGLRVDGLLIRLSYPCYEGPKGHLKLGGSECTLETRGDCLLSLAMKVSAE